MEVSVSFAPQPPYPPPGIHWVGGRVGPRTGLDAVEKRKISMERMQRVFLKLRQVIHVVITVLKRIYITDKSFLNMHVTFNKFI
jgi:hypothetical protein